MADLDLLDPMPKNGRFTWSNKRTEPVNIAARLDHFLVSTPFLQKDFLPTSHIISSSTSDHNPISLSLSTPTNLGPIPFIFNSFWLNNAKTLDLIQSVWNSTFSGSPSFIWESKLRVVCFALKNWATSSYSDPSITQKKFQSGLDSLHSKMELEEITHETIVQEKSLNFEILKATRQEEEILRIKSP